MVAQRLVRRRDHEVGAVEKRAQKNLQAAVAADVVEGRPFPGCRAGRGLPYRAGQRGERVRDELRPPGGSRGGEHPFRVELAGRQRVRRRGGQGDGGRVEVATGEEIGPVGGDDIHLAVLEEGGEIMGRQIGWRDDEAAGNAVEFDQHAGGRDLARCRHQHGAAGEARRGAPETARAAGEGGEVGAPTAVVDRGAGAAGEPGSRRAGGVRQEPARRRPRGRRSSPAAPRRRLR